MLTNISSAPRAVLKIGLILRSECTKTFLNRGVNKAIISNLHRALVPPSRDPRAFKGIAALARSRVDANMFFALCLRGIIARSCQVILASGAAGAPSARPRVTHERGVVCLRADKDMTEHDVVVLWCAVWCVNTTNRERKLSSIVLQGDQGSSAPHTHHGGTTGLLSVCLSACMCVSVCL